MLVIKPNAVQLARIRNAQLESTAAQIDLAREHEDLRTRTANEFKAKRQKVNVEELSMSFEEIIVASLNTLTAEKHEPLPKIKRLNRLHLECPVEEIARIQPGLLAAAYLD